MCANAAISHYNNKYKFEIEEYCTSIAVETVRPMLNTLYYKCILHCILQMYTSLYTTNVYNTVYYRCLLY